MTDKQFEILKEKNDKVIKTIFKDKETVDQFDKNLKEFNIITKKNISTWLYRTNQFLLFNIIDQTGFFVPNLITQYQGIIDLIDFVKLNKPGTEFYKIFDQYKDMLINTDDNDPRLDYMMHSCRLFWFLEEIDFKAELNDQERFWLEFYRNKACHPDITYYYQSAEKSIKQGKIAYGRDSYAKRLMENNPQIDEQELGKKIVKILQEKQPLLVKLNSLIKFGF